MEGLWSLTFPPHWKPPTWIYRTLGPRIGVSVFRISGMPINCLKLYIYTISHFPARRFLILRQPVKLRVIALTSRNKRERERKGNKNLEKGTAKALNPSQGGVGHTVVDAKHTHPSSEFRHACGPGLQHDTSALPRLTLAHRPCTSVATRQIAPRMYTRRPNHSHSLPWPCYCADWMVAASTASLSLPRLQFLPTFFFLVHPTRWYSRSYEEIVCVSEAPDNCRSWHLYKLSAIV